MIVLNKELNIESNENFNHIENNSFSNFEYHGSIYGMVSCYEPISKNETLDKLKSVKSIDEMIKISRYIVGPVWFFIKNKGKLFLISSNAVPSFYFYKKDEMLYFSQIEADICKLAINKEKINPYEIYDIFSTKRFDSVPYGALFKNIVRIPDGHVLELDKNLKLNYYSYLNQKNSFLTKTNYEAFKKTLESITKLYVDSGKKIYLYFSAGIDSFIIFYALNKHSDNIKPIATSRDFKGYFDSGNVHELMKIAESEFGINVEVIHADKFSDKQRSIRDEICKLSSSNNDRWDSCVYYSVIDKYKNKNMSNSIFVTGQEMDDGYGIAHTKFNYSIKGLLYKPFYRYFYTSMYQKNINSFLNKKIRKIFTKNISSSSKDYLLSMAYMSDFQKNYHPVVNKKNKNDRFFDEYLNYKIDTFFKCISEETNDLVSLSEKDLNKKLRILRHYFSVPNVLKGSICRDTFSNLKTLHLPTEGPMIDFFCNLQLGVKDVFIGKRFLHKYFKENTGKNHIVAFSPLKIKRYTPIVRKSFKDDKFKSKKLDQKQFLNSDTFLEDFNKWVDLDDSYLLTHMEEVYVKKYVEKIYKDAKKNSLDYSQLSNIYNMELFLKNL